MRVAVAFRDQTEHERGDYEYRYSSLGRSEAESLPHFIEFETPLLFNQCANPIQIVVVRTTDHLQRSFVSRLLKQERLIRSATLR